jgi:hypothetical protein
LRSNGPPAAQAALLESLESLGSLKSVADVPLNGYGLSLIDTMKRIQTDYPNAVIVKIPLAEIVKRHRGVADRLALIDTGESAEELKKAIKVSKQYESSELASELVEPVAGGKSDYQQKRRCLRLAVQHNGWGDGWADCSCPDRRSGNGFAGRR